jgi:membrane-associated phospholipid phosphatase
LNAKVHAAGYKGLNDTHCAARSPLKRGLLALPRGSSAGWGALNAGDLAEKGPVVCIHHHHAILPATSKLLEGALNDQAVAASTAKDYFHRKFPVTAEMLPSYREWTRDTADRKPESRPLRSYPSVHATLGYSVGVVLAALIPEKSQAILMRAADYAYSREVCGDHYHSDVEASRAFGTALGVMLLNSAALKLGIEAAREKLRAAHLTAE